jgi:membrane fusion protein, adhesin transport system
MENAHIKPLLQRTSGVWRTAVGALKGEGTSYEASRQLLPRAAMLEELPPPASTRLILICVSALVFGFLLWSALVRLDELAVAPGEILPESFVQPVQHLEGGIIAEVKVRDGDRVSAGQTLFLMEGAAAKAELDRARARQSALILQAERSRAFANDRRASFQAQSPDRRRDEEQAILDTQVASRDAQMAVLASQETEARAEIGMLDARASALDRQIALLKEDMAARKELVEKGLFPRLSYLELERELSRLTGDRSEVTGQLGRARASLQEARNRMRETRSRLRSDAMTEFGRISAELEEVNEEVKRLEVKGVQVRSAGAVAQPGALLAEVVPDDAAPVAEVRVSPMDIGHVKVGKPVIVKVSTYDFARYGGIAGRVETVSASSFLDEEGKAYFRARVALERAYVGQAGAGRIVTPGMTIIADIKTGSKTLMAYMMRPVSNALDTGFTER